MCVVGEFYGVHYDFESVDIAKPIVGFRLPCDRLTRLKLPGRSLRKFTRFVVFGNASPRIPEGCTSGVFASSFRYRCQPNQKGADRYLRIVSKFKSKIFNPFRPRYHPACCRVRFLPLYLVGYGDRTCFVLSGLEIDRPQALLTQACGNENP